MKIVIGTNDRQTINPDHFGESKHFCVTEILMAKEHSVECRDNPFYNRGHGIPGKARKIVELLRDCDVVIVKSIGKNAFKLFPDKKIELYLTRLSKIDDTINKFSHGELGYFKKFDPASGKFKECVSV